MRQDIRLHKISECMVFFDFDNTIAPFDVLDDIIERFSGDKEWVKWEKLWKEGKIGSRKCIEEQIKKVRVGRPALLKYLSRVRFNRYFHELIDLLNKKGFKTAILSDNFSFFINAILRNNKVKGIKVYANELRFRKDRLIPAFPYTYRKCGKCGHCKRKNLLSHDLKDKIIIYVGDGLSDVCPAQEADIVFAKGALLEHFRSKKLLCMAFEDFEDIYKYVNITLGS